MTRARLEFIAGRTAQAKMHGFAEAELDLRNWSADSKPSGACLGSGEARLFRIFYLGSHEERYRRGA